MTRTYNKYSNIVTELKIMFCPLPQLAKMAPPLCNKILGSESKVLQAEDGQKVAAFHMQLARVCFACVSSELTSEASLQACQGICVFKQTGTRTKSRIKCLLACVMRIAALPCHVCFLGFTCPNYVCLMSVSGLPLRSRTPGAQS